MLDQAISLAAAFAVTMAAIAGALALALPFILGLITPRR